MSEVYCSAKCSLIKYERRYKMGDYYEFEIKIIDGLECEGFIYQNENTGWNEIFVQFTGEQEDQANNMMEKFDSLRLQQTALIKSWIS